MTSSFEQTEWQDKAACKGMPTQGFTVSRRGEPEVAHLGGDVRKISTYNKRKIFAAMKVCAGCPVRAACLKNSTASDRYWTVRGGQVPKFYPFGLGGRARSSKGDVPSFPAEKFIEFKCKQGLHIGDSYVSYKMSNKTGKPVRYCNGCSGH